MNDVKVIRSIDDLLLYAYEVEQGEKLLPIQLEGSIVVSLRIHGKTWDRRVDSRTAQYVLSLQTVLDELLEEFAPEASRKEPLVKVDNTEGSWASFADISQHIGTLVEKMSDLQIFLAIITCVGVVSGCCMWSRYQERKANVEIAQAKEETARLEIQAKMESARLEAQKEAARQEILQEAFRAVQVRADAHPERFAVYERPLRTIIKNMDEGDTMQVHQLADNISAKDAKHCGPRRAPRSEESVTYADGSYVVNRLSFTEGEIVLELEQGGTTIKGYLTQLDQDDRSSFLKSLDRYKEEELPFSMDLQLNVIHTSKKLKYASILGEGAPREGKHCKQLSQILGS